MAVPPPISLLPSPFPRELYEEVVAIQPTLNELYFRISLDREFLLEAYKEVIGVDPFIARHIDIMEKVHKEGLRKKFTLLVQRADYLTHINGETNKLEIKQVGAVPFYNQKIEGGSESRADWGARAEHQSDESA